MKRYQQYHPRVTYYHGGEIMAVGWSIALPILILSVIISFFSVSWAEKIGTIGMALFIFVAPMAGYLLGYFGESPPLIQWIKKKG